MAAELIAIRFAAGEPRQLARFWSELLGREVVDDPHDGVALLPADDGGVRIGFAPSTAPKLSPNLGHFDLTSTSLQDQRHTVDRALGLGARHIDIGQRPEEGHVVLADPEGNEFCVIEPGNDFLAGCGFVGALSCDGTQQLGYFWSAALGWPLVWDRDEETAIQSPRGGMKISWGGPPLAVRSGEDRLRLVLAPPAGGDQQAEADRLLSLGATRVGTGRGEDGGIRLADPDGNEFLLLPRSLRTGPG